MEDISLGLSCYSTGYKDPKASHSSHIKIGEGDFIVEEIFKHVLHPESRWILFRIKKPYGIDTMSLKTMLFNKIPSKYIHFYGLKDKYAVALQYVVVHRKYTDLFTNILVDKDINIYKIGYVDEPHTLNKLFEGNYFQLTIYNPPEEGYLRYILNISEKIGIPNYYGYQRFGIYRVNHIIGKAFLLGRNYLDSLPESLYHMVSKAIDPKLIFDEKEVYRKSNRYIIRFYIHSFQSYLFNKVLSLRMNIVGDLSKTIGSDFCLEYVPTLNKWIVSYCGNVSPKSYGGLLVPIIGYDYLKMSSNDSFRNLYMSLLSEEGVSLSDFKNLAEKSLIIRGGFRKALMKLSDINYNYRGSKLILSFKLGKGEYATVFLRELIKPISPQKQGF